MDVVLGNGFAVVEVLALIREALRVGGDTLVTLLVLDLGLDHEDCVRGLDIDGDGVVAFVGMPDKYLHGAVIALGGGRGRRGHRRWPHAMLTVRVGHSGCRVIV